MKSLIIFLFLFSTAYAESSYVRLYNFKSPYGVDWESPRSLFFSVAKNLVAHKLGFRNNSKEIGHNAIELSCRNRDGTKKSLFTGMASHASTTEALDLLFLKNSGLGVLLHRYKGRHETHEDLESVIKKGVSNGDINSITYLIDDSKCSDLLKHNERWVQNKAYLNYGLQERPETYTGSGCSAYAMSFIKDFKIANEKQYNSWLKTIYIDKELIGPHNRQAYTQDKQGLYEVIDGNGPSIFRLILQSRWASPFNKAALKLNFWSPDAMYDWVAKRLKPGQTDLQISVL
ncbi:MAG: hypothetical protein KC478_04595 [Bacteriovoracaceae bacterium]|nr:hypothetical protein [Bacteriovoracaceae bacterium]